MALPIPEYQVVGGAVGAAGSLLLLIAVPYFLAVLNGKADVDLAWKRVIAALLLLVATLFLGVLSAVVAGSTDLKTAIVAGLAYQSTLAGVAKSYSG